MIDVIFQLLNGKLELTGSTTPDDATNTLNSSVLPLTFQLLPAQPRPHIRITHTPSNKTWEA